MRIFKFSNFFSLIALLISIITLCLFWTRLSAITMDWIGIIIGILAILTTILIGWNIFLVIDFKKIARETEEKHHNLVLYSETNLLIMYKTSADFAAEKNNIFGVINNSIFAIDIAIRLGNYELAQTLLDRVIEVAPDEIIMNSYYKSMIATSFYSVKKWKTINDYKKLEDLILNIKINDFVKNSQLDYL